MGLNLLYETRLGLAKHRSTYDEPTDVTFSEKNCSLEGQVADIADRIAYNCHDLEDGMRARIIESKQLMDIEIFSKAREEIGVENISDHTIRRARTVKAIINKLVCDCIETSKQNIAGRDIMSPEDVYEIPENLVAISNENDKQLEQLEKFLLENFYLHDSVVADEKIRGWLGVLFEKLCEKPELMPSYFRNLSEHQPMTRCVCDYIVGMTDRYCIETLKARSLSN
jgi:dGTPase